MTVDLRRFTLYEKQQEALKFIHRCGGNAALFADMGTGKTRTSLAYLTYRGIKRAVIICETDYVRGWEREIHALLPDVPVLVLPGSGTIASQAAKVKAFRDGIVLVTYDAMWRKPLEMALLRYQPEAVVADEIHRLKHHTSKRSRYAARLAKQPSVVCRLGLSGTPSGAKLKKAFSKDAQLQNFYSEFLIVDPTLLPAKWEDFQAQYMRYKKVPGVSVPILHRYVEIEDLEALVRSKAFFIHKDEMLDLPPTVDVIVPVELNPTARRKYEELKDYSIAQIDGLDENGLPVIGTVISRVTVSLLTKLQQLTSGSVKTDEGVIDYSDDKLNVCLTLVEDALPSTNVTIACRYRRDISRITDAVRAKFKGVQVVNIQGGMARAAREAAIDVFARQEPVVLVGQIRAMSLGINDLVVGNVAILYSIGFEPDTFIQFEGRFDRLGQTRKSTFFHLVATHTVDEDILAALIAGIDVQVRAQNIQFARALLMGNARKLITG